MHVSISAQVPVIVKALHKQLKEKSLKSRQGCFCVLTELAYTVPGSLEEHIPALIPGIYAHWYWPILIYTTFSYFFSAFHTDTTVSLSFFFLASLLCLSFSFTCYFFFPSIPLGIVFSLTDKSTSSTMRIDALSFFHILLISHPPQAFQPHMQVAQTSHKANAVETLNKYIEYTFVGTYIRRISLIGDCAIEVHLSNELFFLTAP